MLTRYIAPLAAFALFSCADATAVHTTSSQLIVASSLWNAVTDQFKASCDRRRQFETVASECAAEKRASDSLRATTQILSSYFMTLQKASASGAFSTDTGTSALSETVGSLATLSAAESKAVRGLALYLANLGAASLRDRALKALIQNGAPEARAVIGVISSVTTRELDSLFVLEETITRAMYASYVNAAGDDGALLLSLDCSEGPSVRAFRVGSGFLLAESYCGRVQAISRYRKALETYRRSLMTADASLQDLERGKDNLSAKALAAKLGANVASLREDISKLNAAF